VINAQTFEVERYLLVGQRVWNLAFSPDQKRLYTTNGTSNDISIIDLDDQKVTKSVGVVLILGSCSKTMNSSIALSIEDLSFSYGGKKALDQVNFKIQPGECTILLGPNGAGKSTLFSLITRLYDTAKGA